MTDVIRAVRTPKQAKKRPTRTLGGYSLGAQSPRETRVKVVDAELAGRFVVARMAAAREIDAAFSGLRWTARRLGMPVSTLQTIESAGRFGPKSREKYLLTILSVYNIRKVWLLLGEGPMRARRVPVRAEIDKNVSDMPDSIIGYEDHPADVAQDLDAYRITTADYYPAVFPGDVVYTEKMADPKSVVGRSCVAMLTGNRLALGVARATMAGTIVLGTFFGVERPAAEIVEAAPIAWIKRGS